MTLRLFVVAPMLGTPGHGASIADEALLRDLVAAGHTLRIVTNPGAADIPGAEVIALDGVPPVERFVDAFHPDIVLISGWISRSLSVLRSYSCVLLDHGGAWSGLPTSDTRRFVQGCIVPSSADLATPHYPPAFVLHPPETGPARVEGSGEAVLIAATTEAKGFGLFRQIAAGAPELPFVAVHVRGPEVPSPGLPNVRMVEGPIPMDDLVRRCRVLVAPSERESYGMTPRACAAAGRPVIAADLPGLRESCGAGALYLPTDDPEPWIVAVRRAFAGQLPLGSVPTVERATEIAALGEFLLGLASGQTQQPVPTAEPAPPSDWALAPGPKPDFTPLAPGPAGDQPLPMPMKGPFVEITNARPLIMGFLKIHNEVARGNLTRVLTNLDSVCDLIAVCDDGSYDDSHLFLEGHPKIPPDLYLRYGEAKFEAEIDRKAELLRRVGARHPEWILWLDGDEILDAAGTVDIRAFLQAQAEATDRSIQSFDMPEINLWAGTSYYRTDSGFEAGRFRRIWRWAEDLRYPTGVNRLHADQCPEPLRTKPTSVAPYRCLHYGNASLPHLRWKAIQYHPYKISLDRHLDYKGAEFRPVPPGWLPPEAERIAGPPPTDRLDPTTIARIRALGSLQHEPGLFVIVIPAFNRAAEIGRAIESVQAQGYEKWLAIVIDDGSTDETEAVARRYSYADPRIMVLRFPMNRGGVAVNELGMRLASRWGEYWTRLGSDDWWSPDKLGNDVRAFQAGARAVWGPYRVHEAGQFHEAVSNPQTASPDVKAALVGGRFAVGWANVATRADVLDAVQAEFGSYVDARLHNMEDFCFNWRVAKLGIDWTWRPGPDGVWNVNKAAGASYREGIMAKDSELMRQIVGGP